MFPSKFMPATMTAFLSIAPAMAMAAVGPSVQLWEFNAIDRIGGHPVTVLGNPKVVDTEIGKAVSFDGDGDRLLVGNQPIGDAKAFTVEVVFKPAAAINKTNDPRFLHIQDPDDPAGKRLMMEIRVDSKDQWALDGMLVTDMGDRILFDASRGHATGVWAHAAVTYDGKTLRTYVNGVAELQGDIGYKTTLINGKGAASVGARMNEKYWLLGLVRAIRVSHAALLPKDFLPIDGTASGRVVRAGSHALQAPRPDGRGWLAIPGLSPSSASDGPLRLVLTALSGSRVRSATVDPHAPATLFVGGLPPGAYLLSAESAGSRRAFPIRLGP